MFFRKLVYDLLGDRRPEEISFIHYNELRKQNKLCDSYAVFLGSWDIQRKGMMIGEPIAMDLLRAAAYKHLDIAVHEKKLLKKQLVVSVGKAIENAEDFMKYLKETYASKVHEWEGNQV